MARRKKGDKVIKMITQKDEYVFNHLRVCGCLSKGDLMDNYNISNARINNYVRDNYLQITKDGNYRFGDYGKDYCKKNLGFDSFYSSSSDSHDLALSKIYVNLTDEEKSTCMTENETRAYYKNKFLQDNDVDKLNKLDDNQYSVPDITYISGGVVKGEEVITKNYKIFHIQQKVNFCLDASIDCNYTKI